MRRPVSINLEPATDRISPSFNGVSVHEENKNARSTTPPNAPIESNAIMSLLGLEAKLVMEKISVSDSVIANTISAKVTMVETTP